MKDCKNVTTYFEEKARMTKHCKISCSICPLCGYNNGTGVSCYKFEQQFPDKAIELVQKWSDNNVIPTLRRKLLEVFPDADMNSLCVEYIGFSNVNEHCTGDCKSCWDQPYKRDTE